MIGRTRSPVAVLVLMALTVLVFVPTARAGVGAELAEWLARQGTKYADDVAGRGAGVLARELDELAAKSGSEAVEQMVRRGGPGALALVRGLGDGAPAAARLIAAHGEAGTLVLRQGGPAALQAFTSFGDGAVRVLAQHGPVQGQRMLAAYGAALSERMAEAGARGAAGAAASAGVNAGVGGARAALSGESQAVLRALMPEVERAEPAVRRTLQEKLAQGGDDFVQWVGKRWKSLGAAALLTVGTLTAYRVGDGVAAAMPDPAANPAAFMVWSLPILAIVLMVAGAWVLRGAVIEWLRARATR